MKLISRSLLLSFLLTFGLFGSTIEPSHKDLNYSGRIAFSEEGYAQLGYSGCRLYFNFVGSSIEVKMRSTRNPNWLSVVLDGKLSQKIEVGPEFSSYTVAADLGPGVHKLELVKATEGYEGNIEIADLVLPENGKLLPLVSAKSRKIEFIGDSITCGYGIEANDPNLHWEPATENFCYTYAWHTAHALEADYLVVARSGIGMLRNYNGPANGNKENLPYLYNRTFFHDTDKPWDFSHFQPNVVCINLGTNDFSTSGVNTTAFEEAYLEFVQRLLQQYKEAKIVCLLGPMLNTDSVKEILQRIVESANAPLPNARVFHFEMTPQGSLGHGADWHPSKAQAKLNAEELTAYLQDLMHW